MKKVIFIAGVAGLALFIALMVKQGLGDVASALSTAGAGLIIVALFHFVPVILDALSWHRLMPREHKFTLWQATWMRWVGESVNNLLPAAQVGGDVARARLASHNGIPMSASMAAMVVDVTSTILTQALFTLLGLGLLVMQHGKVSFGWQVLLGVLVAKGVFLSFYLVQRKGLFAMLKKMGGAFFSGPTWEKLLAGGDAFDKAINATYARWGDFLVSLWWTFVSWVAGAGEVWLGMYFLGHPVTLAEAVIIESLSQAIKGALFVVPGTLGFQEGGFMVLGKLLGIPPELALTMSLIKRVRELSLGIPGLIVWQIVEGKKLLKSSGEPSTNKPAEAGSNG